LGSILAAVVSSACCLGPVALSLLGVGSSAGIFAGLKAYRPYFIGLTAVFLGWAFYLAYRSRKVQCADGTCKIERAGRWNRLGVWLATLAAAWLITFPYVAGTIANRLPSLPSTGAVQTAPPSSSSPLSLWWSTQALRQLTLAVAGMTCPACALMVKQDLLSAPGVLQASVDYETAQGVVVYDGTKTTPKQIMESLKPPYAATMLEDRPLMLESPEG